MGPRKALAESVCLPGTKGTLRPAWPNPVPTTIRVRYAETDAMGIVHHAVYPVWMELGRSDLLRAMGQGYSEWEAQGVFMAVGELRVKDPGSGPL